VGRERERERKSEKERGGVRERGRESIIKLGFRYIYELLSQNFIF